MTGLGAGGGDEALPLLVLFGAQEEEASFFNESTVGRWGAAYASSSEPDGVMVGVGGLATVRSLPLRVSTTSVSLCLLLSFMVACFCEMETGREDIVCASRLLTM